MRGLNVVVAENGQMALQKFLSSAPGTYRAILMDIRMPIMDGVEATRRIRLSEHEQAKTVPIIAMTANAFQTEQQDAEAAGISGYLTKPIDSELLYRTLHRALKRE